MKDSLMKDAISTNNLHSLPPDSSNSMGGDRSPASRRPLPSASGNIHCGGQSIPLGRGPGGGLLVALQNVLIRKYFTWHMLVYPYPWSLLLIWLGSLGFSGCTQHKKEVSEKENPVYLFSYFEGNGEDGLHLAYSQDGLQWKVLNQDQSFLTPEVGQDKLMRDPCITQGPDGHFHMVWTVSWTEKGIGMASSPDLIHWSEQQYVPVMEQEADAMNCWAPEIFYDKTSQQYLIFWATTIPGRFPETDNQSSEGPPHPGNNHRIYYVTSKDLKHFSETRLFYDQGFNVIDATIRQDGRQYVMFLKDETNKPFKTQKNIRVAFSDQATGPYGPPSAPITGDFWAEGPTAIKIGDTWYVYFDRYRDHRYGVVTSKDLKNWQDISGQLQFPEKARHGTVFQVSENALEKLKTMNP